MVDINVDNGSTNNLISAKAVTAIKLQMSNHGKPYNVGWIRAGESVKMVKQCLVPITTGAKYEGKILCDVVEMDATRIILGRPCWS